MLKKRSFRRTGAFILALLFTTAWSVNVLHDFFLHHEHPTCATAYNGKGAHIHDERFEAHGCTLCALLMSGPALLSLPVLPAPSVKLPESTLPNFYNAPSHSKTACDSTFRRGPPVM